MQSGDVDASSGMIWTRVDRPARVLMEYDTTGRFADPTRLAPLDALPESDFAVKRLLAGLPPDQDIFYRFVAEDLSSPNRALRGPDRRSAPPRRPAETSASPGLAIPPDKASASTPRGCGPMPRSPVMRPTSSSIPATRSTPTVRSSDEVALADGTAWRNLMVTDAKRKVAETLDEFRGQWKYNLLDAHLLAMHARVPVFLPVGRPRGQQQLVAVAVAPGGRPLRREVGAAARRARRAFHEMTPVRFEPTEPGRIYRRIAHGPLLDVFFLDFRSYRGPNYLAADQDRAEARNLLGDGQLAWLKRELAASRATWKVIAVDMPIGLVSWEATPGGRAAEAVANGTGGGPRGREREFAELLRHIKAARVANTVWLTADVHYTAAHHYDPSRAGFQDFEPFWEFVSGPLHAGSFAQKALDPTFGPEVRFVKAPPLGLGAGVGPSGGFQFFGLVDIDGATAQLTVRLMDRDDAELWRITLDPAPGT